MNPLGRQVVQAFHRKPLVDPGLEAAGQYLDPADPPALQPERHPGAGGLLRSGTENDNLSALGYLLVFSGQFFHRHMPGPRNGQRILF